MPLIEKLKQFDIEDNKHASAIFSGNIEPVEFTIPVNAQTLEFLVLAITGNTSGNEVALTSHDVAMIQTITCPAESGNIVQGDYLLIDAITSNIIEHFAVWMDTAGDGSTGKPTITGINASNILAANISANTPSNTATQIATAVTAILDADATFGAASSAAVVTVTHAATGAVQPARDGAAPTECTFSVSTWGVTNYAVPEAKDTSTPSFTIHVEQRNLTSAQDIVWDIFGCVIDAIIVDVNFSDKIVRANITFKTPYALENTNGRCTNPPPKKQIAAFPTMLALKEATDQVLIQEGATATLNDPSAGDKTPETVDKVTLSIKNNIQFKGDIEHRYMTLAVAGKREVEMNVVGLTGEKTLFTYYQGAYKASGADWIPTSASAKLNTFFRLERNASTDYILIHIYNWLTQAHNFHFVDVDEAVKSVDMTFEDGSGDSNGRIIDDCDYISSIDETIMIV